MGEPPPPRTKQWPSAFPPPETTAMKRSILLFPLLAPFIAAAASSDDALRSEAQRRFGRLEAPPPESRSAPEARLGRILFWDSRASLDGKTACASCHTAEAWGADRRALSRDARGELTSRHSPTVFNAVAEPALRWLADRPTLAIQAEGSITGSMGFKTKEGAIMKLRALGYDAAFTAAFAGDPDPLSAANYGRALAAYEATLVTPAPFDRFLAGDNHALGARQKAGLRAFIEVGCAGCHDGALFGGTQLRKFGLAKEYWTETGSAKPDVGRYAVTKKDEDKYVFRVAMLRNVARTAPYFHDGSVDTLESAVALMGKVQLGRTLDRRIVALIAAFLDSLSGDVPADYAPPPAGMLAASGDLAPGNARRPAWPGATSAATTTTSPSR
jgi:cytochrome c peroxidase